jgi:hypothetical protein
MKPIELWRWRLRDDMGRLHTTSFIMTEADATDWPGSHGINAKSVVTFAFSSISVDFTA